jgi:hypothetical protein
VLRGGRLPPGTPIEVLADALHDGTQGLKAGAAM